MWLSADNGWSVRNTIRHIERHFELLSTLTTILVINLEEIVQTTGEHASHLIASPMRGFHVNGK